MLNSQTLLEIKHKAVGFTDLKSSAADLTRDSFVLELAATDYLYVGFEKPIANIYVELKTVNDVSNVFIAEYYNGTTWDTLSILDETNGFERSGFIQWEKPTDWEEVAVDSTTKYWIRFQPSQAHATTDSGTNVELYGIGLVFSDDNDLRKEFPLIDDEVLWRGSKLSADESYVKLHVAARDQIVQKFRNKGYLKVTNGTTKKNITAWDLLDIDEVKQGSIYLVLAKVFMNANDNIDSTWYQKAQHYQALADEQLKLALLSIDVDDDGIADPWEKLALSKNVRMSK